MAEFFDATSIEIGFCKKPDCRAVHFQLLDASGVARAQAVFACETVDAVCADLQSVKAQVDSGRARSH